MKAPTDLELMMFADGELGEPRHTEVARFLASTSEAGDLSKSQSKDAHTKLLGLAAVGDLVRDQASRLATLHAADGIADVVMKSIEAMPVAEGTSADAAVGKKGSRARAVGLVGGSRDSSSTSGDPKRKFVEPKAKPANDNNRFIYAMAGLAAAAAVALGVWGRTAPPPEASGREPVVRDVPTPALSSPVVLTATAEARVDSTARPDSTAQLGDSGAGDEASVKVASVDFGVKTGTVFYVPKDTPGATTAVVWLAEQ